ncbi:MAG: hypothetical protein ACK4ME_03100 [Fimbriimonadales bacterium]
MKILTVRGIVRQNSIQLLEPVALPEGSAVEVEIHWHEDSLIGSMAAYDSLLEEISQEILQDRSQRQWRSNDVEEIAD